MLRFVQTDLFQSPAQTLVNTVNTVGVMGKGIAKQFKALYPPMFTEYHRYCESGELTIGALHVWRGPDKWVLNFPTKTTWRKESKIEYIRHGLQTFRNHYKSLGITSIAFPPLGCGNGDLDWHEVRPLMIQHLHNLDVPIWIHELFFAKGFNAEQKEPFAKLPPATFADFTRDFRSIVNNQSGAFHNLVTGEPFRAAMGPGAAFEVYVDRVLVLDEEYLADTWAGLRLGVVTLEMFGCTPDSEKFAGFVLPILKELPYVSSVPFVRGTGAHYGARSYGLMFNQRIEAYDQKVTSKAS